MNRLITEGHTNILPRNLGNSITFEGEQVDITRRQHAAFGKIYNASNDTLVTMISSRFFERLDDAARATAIRRVHEFYWNLGVQNLMGVELENRTLLMGQAVPIEYLAMVAAQANLITADTDRAGRPIQGTRKKQIQEMVNRLPLNAAQKYMVMGFLGYRNQRGETAVRAQISRLGLSRELQSSLLKMSGYNINTRGRVA